MGFNRGGFRLKTYEVKFKKGAEVASITLYSHYTCVIGKYSGEGKSEFLAEIAEGIQVGDVEIESELPVSIADATSLPGILTNPNRQVVIIDELAMLRNNLIRQINESIHLFVGITRGNPVRLEYPLKGIYSVNRTLNWFNIISLSNTLPLITECRDCQVIMEGKPGRSEHELLAKYFKNCIAVSGRNNLEHYLRDKDIEIHVYADLGAIGNAFSLLRKRCKNNPNIKFYDYQAFEQLLVESPLLSEDNLSFDNFNFMSFEKYYEFLLERILSNKGIAFKHGESLPDLIKNASVEELFDSNVGKPLLSYVAGKGLANVASTDTMLSF